MIAICVSGSVLGLGLFAITLSQAWPAGALLPLYLLFRARLIDGVSGGTAATAGAVLADITPLEKRARAFGLIGVAFGLGFIIGPFLGGQLARIAVTVPIWVATGFALLNLVVVLTLLPETHPVSERRVPAPQTRAQPLRSSREGDWQSSSGASWPWAFFCSFLHLMASQQSWCSISNNDLTGGQSLLPQPF